MKGDALNKMCCSFRDAANRQAFLDDEEGYCTRHGLNPQQRETVCARNVLTPEERDLVRRRDWRGLIHYGVIFFMLEKLGAVLGVSNLHIYAAMRDETLEQSQKTRNAPGALYSVAGKDAGALAWDSTDTANA
jgi:hypothetical protein